MAKDDIKGLQEEIATLKRHIAGMVRIGTVKKRQKGAVQVTYQAADVGGETYDSPLIRTGRAGRGVANHTFAEGETVLVLSPPGSPDQATVHPGGHSDNNPMDENADKDYDTIRYRKPPQEDQQGQQQGQSSGDSGSGGGGQGQYGAKPQQRQKWKDDKEDHQGKSGYDKHWRKIGDKAEFDMTPKRTFVAFDKGSVEMTAGKTVIKQGETTWTLEEGKATLKADKIYLDGEVYLGGEGAADKVATEKTLDSRGGRLLPPFAEKAKAR